MLLFQLLQGQVRGGLVVTHVVVPRLRELQELGLLRCLDVLQLLLLGRSDVVLLSNSLFSQQLVEFAPGLLRFLIIALDFALLPVLLQQPQEIEDLVVR